MRNAALRAVIAAVIAAAPALAFGAVLLGTAGPARAEPIKIHVRGTAVIQAFAAGEPGGFSIEGEVDDDAGAPIAHAPLVLGPAARDGLAILSLEPCRAGVGRVHSRVGDGYALEASDTGGFCFVGKSATGQGSVRLHFAGEKLHDPANLEVAVDAGAEQRIRTLLRFDSPAETIDLDRDAFAVTVSLRIDRAEALRSTAAARREGLALVLEDERGQRLGEATTGGDGRAHFEVTTTALAGPGAGELTLRFAGNDVLAKASLSQAVVRRAEAHLALAHAAKPGDADDGAAVEVTVSTARGPVEGGVVEALHGVDSVGAAPVEHGNARVVAGFPPRAENPMKLRLRFVPAAPYYKAGPEIAAEVALAGPSPLRQILLALVVVALAAWVVAGWRRAPKQAVVGGKEVLAPPSGKAGVAVLASPPGIRGWRGVVTDAHDGAPIPLARLRIVTPSFQGDGVVAEAEADAAGNFKLDGEPQAGARLVVDSELHASYEQALPPPSILGIALVTRRRALLERLVRWARRQGAPFDMAPEPTPGHVRRAATRNEASSIAEWAASVEQAAYGPEPVGPGVEKDVRAAEPHAR